MAGSHDTAGLEKNLNLIISDGSTPEHGTDIHYSSAITPVVATGAGVSSRNWRDDLPRLEPLNLPLLPCGAGAVWKAPIDPDTGKALQRWPERRFTVPQILAMNGVVLCVGTKTGAGLLAFDVDGGSAVELLLEHGCDPQQAKTWQVQRNTDHLRFKVLWQLSAEQQAELGEVNKTAPTANPAGGRKGEALELFSSPGKQVVVLGEHRESGGQYFWPEGRGPEALSPIPEAWWAMALKIARGEIENGTKTPAAPKSSSEKGEWIAINPCPICGRDTTGWCTKRPASDAINCRHGNTFSPRLAHGVLKRGQVVMGTDGVAYAFGQEKWQSDGQKVSHFVLHKELTKTGKKPPKPRQAEKEGEPLSSPPEAFGEFICALPDGWRLTKNGLVPSRLSAGDLAHFLEKLGEWLRFNELEMRPEVHTKKGWQVVSDADMGSAYVLLSQNGWLIEQGPIEKAILHEARKRSVHPVREYLLRIEEESSIAPYDLDQVGPAMFRAVAPLHATMVRKWLIGAVARALNPGCKMDYCLVLQSPKQGLYKSTAFAELASPEWHTSTIPKEEKDMLLNIHSTWLYELAELESFTSKREAGHIKNTLTTAIDNFRVPYGRTTEKKKRSGVFCGTANSDTFLRDDTGNRRFWIIPIEGDQKLDIAAIKKHRDSIWKAAVLAYRSGELPMLDDDQEALSEHQNDAYRERDAWREMLEAWIQGEALFKKNMDGPPSKAFRLGDFYSSAEILYSAGLKQATQITRGEETRLGPLLRSLGFQKKRVVVGGHSLQRWYANSSDCNPAGESSGVSVDAPPETTRRTPITEEEELEQALRAAIASGNLRKFLPDEKGHPPLATTEVATESTCHRRTPEAEAGTERRPLEDWWWPDIAAGHEGAAFQAVPA